MEKILEMMNSIWVWILDDGVPFIGTTLTYVHGLIALLTFFLIVMAKPKKSNERIFKYSHIFAYVLAVISLVNALEIWFMTYDYAVDPIDFARNVFTFIIVLLARGDIDNTFAIARYMFRHYRRNRRLPR